MEGERALIAGVRRRVGGAFERAGEKQQAFLFHHVAMVAGPQAGSTVVNFAASTGY